MPKPTFKKEYDITLQEKPFLPYDGPLMEGTFEDFVKTVGGELAVALFQGKFKEMLYTYLSIAQARGKSDYHERLVGESKHIRHVKIK